MVNSELGTPLSADGVHMSADIAGAEGGRMLKGLLFDGVKKHLGQVGVEHAGAKRGFDVLADIGEQAGPDAAVRSEPQAVAFLAEMVADRTDKADFAGSSGKPPALGRPVIGLVLDRKQGAQLFQPFSDVRVKEGFGAGGALALARRCGYADEEIAAALAGVIRQE